jgi:hypothetical protein
MKTIAGPNKDSHPFMVLKLLSGRENAFLYRTYLCYEGYKEGKRMESVSLSIPFVVLSTEHDIAGEMEEHILTPFGHIDVRFPAPSSPHDSSAAPHPEIKVLGDIDPWLVQGPMPQEFTSTLSELILKIVRSRRGAGFPPLRMMSMCFEGPRFEIRFCWKARQSEMS